MAGSEPIVAIVAKAPRAGAVKTRLCPPLTPDDAATLHEAFPGDTVELVAGVAGTPAVIAIGADAPTLPATFVADALTRLTDRGVDAVLGPTDDGGYYLIGMTRRHAALFDAIPWSTPAVLHTTLARASEARLRVSLLPAWFDVDVPADLARLATSLGESPAPAARTRALLRAWTAARV